MDTWPNVYESVNRIKHHRFWLSYLIRNKFNTKVNNYLSRFNQINVRCSQQFKNPKYTPPKLKLP